MKGLLRARLAGLLDGILLLMVLGSAIAIGAVHAPIVAGLAGLCIVFALLVAGGTLRQTRGFPLPLTFWALLAVGVWSLVQSLPLGMILGVFGGSATDTWGLVDSDVVRLTGNLSPTVLMAVKGSGAALVFAGAFYYFHRTDRIDRMTTLIIGSASLLAVLALIQSWLNTDTVAFFYDPEMGPVRPGLRGSLVNPDHFGAYAAIAALLAIGRGVVLRADRVRYVYQGLSVLLVAAVLLSYSLSALLGLLVGVFGLWLAWQRQRSRVGAPLRVAGPIIVAGLGLAVATYVLGLTTNPTVGILAQGESLQRIPEVWGATAGVVLDNPIVGIGSGTLADVLGGRLDPPATSVWFARNQVLQSMADLGVPVAIFLLFGLLLALRHLRKSWHTEDIATMVPVASAVWGLVAIGMLDFALEIPAIGVVGVLLLGALCGQGVRYERRQKPGPQGLSGRILAVIGSRPTAVLVATSLVVAVTAVWGVAATHQQKSAESNFDSVTGSLAVDEGELEKVDESARAVLRFRPGFGRIYTRAGRMHLFAEDARGAIDWLSRAVQLLPTDPSSLTTLGIAHLHAGDVDSALEILQESMALDPGVSQAVVASLVSREYDFDLWHVVTAELEIRDQLAAALIDEGRFFEALSYASMLLGAEPRDVLALDLACQAAMGLRLQDLAGYFAARLQNLSPGNVTAELVLAGAAVNSGEFEVAIARLERATEQSPDAQRLWFALGDALVSAAEYGQVSDGYEQRVESIRERIRPIIYDEAKWEAEYYWLSARFFTSTEHWPAAATAARHGVVLAPNNAYFHLILANALESQEDLDGAENSRRQARAIDPTAVYPPPALEDDFDEAAGASGAQDDSVSSESENAPEEYVIDRDGGE